MQDFDRRYARDQQAHRERLARLLWQGRVDAQRSRAAHETRMRAFFHDLRAGEAVTGRVPVVASASTSADMEHSADTGASLSTPLLP